MIHISVIATLSKKSTYRGDNVLSNLLRVHAITQLADTRIVKYSLQVPTIVGVAEPMYSDGLPVTLENHLVTVVHGNCARARVALMKPGDSFAVVFRLLNTHLVPPLVVNLRYLCDSLAPKLLYERLHLSSEALGVTVNQQAASTEHDHPSLIEVRLMRDSIHE